MQRAVATYELGHCTHAPAIIDVREEVEDVWNVWLDYECGVNDRYSHSSCPVECGY